MRKDDNDNESDEDDNYDEGDEDEDGAARKTDMEPADGGFCSNATRI